MALKTKITVLLFFAFSSMLKAQKQTNFFGHKFFFGMGAALPVSGLVKDRPNSMSNAKVNLDAQLNSYLMLGSSLSLSRIEMTDRFDNDGVTRDYHVNNSGKTVTINGGKGNYNIQSGTLLLHLKKYNRRVSYVPIGRYFSLVAGVTMNRMTVLKDYQFYYSEYYAGVKNRYISIENHQYNFAKFNVGFELGKTMRLFSDNSFLTFSGTLLRSSTKSFSYNTTLTDRFKHLGEIAMNKQLLFQLNFVLSFGI